MIDFKIKVVDKLEELKLDISREEIISLIEIPPESSMGDYAFPVFKFAKTFKKAPNLIAEELAGKLTKGEFFSNIVNTGPYINFFVNNELLTKEVLEGVLNNKKFGSKNIGLGKTAIVEFSSTNIAKPFHIGHLRSTVIGNSINNILKYQDYNTVAINYIGDYGTQFGMMISAYKKWGSKEIIDRDPINGLLDLYVRYNKEAKENEVLMDEARYWFDRLEKKDKEALELWQWFKDISLKEFNRVYELLGVKFDNYNGEAYHSQFMGEVIKELEEKNLLKESEGAIIVDLEKYDLPPVLIKKSNGSSTYITRDIATAIYRKKTYDFYKNNYVVASQQRLHFQQLVAVLKEMGYEWADDCVHVSFGMVSMKDGAMKTREGKVIFLEEVLNQAISKTNEIIENRNPDLENKEKVAKEIGVGAIIFQDLFNNRIKDYVFDWDQVLNFDGETGPYVQYANARASSILNKVNFQVEENVDYTLLKEEEEIAIIKILDNFSNVLENAANKLEPSFVTRYSVELAKAFNRFYNSCPISSAEENLKSARLLLTYATKVVLTTSLNLLGIAAPEKM
ncbi:arginine--tRNA ligase [Miniphocaeibacter halophilus]|uniref:Arginine--tRNA ligase n=1 Tax=Miniphocaeibacter halophilus TaxID=2931922 RepID=A0AC61MPP4_9FIRM|nr:arginine--tRNA ligase [Miniphocaeibacter halophilus]QQK07527.1 arginine--tRNA ligase [Miniphocaeibacter halophilus]